jgi:hypothetical protein
MNIPNLTTSNLLSWDDISKIPFPDETKEVAYCINWKEVIWQTFGLPIHLAKYSIVGGVQLYLDELADGTAHVTKQEFTGEIVASILMLDEANIGTYHYVVVFSLTFFKGELKEVIHLNLERFNKEDYKRNFNEFEVKYKKNIKIVTSWWFKWLYRPYRGLMKSLFFIPVVLCTFGRLFLIKLLGWITPL